MILPPGRSDGDWTCDSGERGTLRIEIDADVHLGGADVCVAQDVSDDHQGHAGLEEMHGLAVSQGMRSNVSRESGLSFPRCGHVLGEDVRDPGTGHPFTTSILEQGRTRTFDLEEVPLAKV